MNTNKSVLTDEQIMQILESVGYSAPAGKLRISFARAIEAAVISHESKACVCGEPDAAGTTHRIDGPCYVTDAAPAPADNPSKDEILSLHRQLAAEKLRADQGWQRAEAKSKECIELRERMAASDTCAFAPDGYALVPLQPTKSMIEAFESMLEGLSGGFFEWDHGGTEGYAAMLAAAPTLAKEG